MRQQKQQNNQVQNKDLCGEFLSSLEPEAWTTEIDCCIITELLIRSFYREIVRASINNSKLQISFYHFG